MAIKNIICRGIGFSPGSVKFIPTRGFAEAAAPPPPNPIGGNTVNTTSQGTPIGGDGTIVDTSRPIGSQA